MGVFRIFAWDSRETWNNSRACSASRTLHIICVFSQKFLKVSALVFILYQATQERPFENLYLGYAPAIKFS